MRIIIEHSKDGGDTDHAFYMQRALVELKSHCYGGDKRLYADDGIGTPKYLLGELGHDIRISSVTLREQSK